MNGPEARLPRADRRSDIVEPRQSPEAGLILRRGVFADERTARVVVLVREQEIERSVVRIPVEGVAIGKGELRALGDDMDELGLGKLCEIEALEKRELL